MGPEGLSIDEGTLRTRVALMRELGVVQWGDLLIGPAPASLTPAEPAKPLSDEERLERIKQRIRDKSRVLFAASGVGVSEEEIERLARIELAQITRGEAA